MKNRRREVSEQVQEIYSSFSTPGNSIFSLVDISIMTGYNITDEEIQIINDNATEEELDDFLCVFDKEIPSISRIKKGIKVRNKYVKYFQK